MFEISIFLKEINTDCINTENKDIFIVNIGKVTLKM